MRKCFWAVCACLVLTLSCTEKKKSIPVIDEPTDSVADSVVVVEDSLELLITETPMPRAADAMFDDFIFNFAANKRLQFERIIFPLHVTRVDGTSDVRDKEQWQMEHFFMRQGYYTLLFDDDNQMALMKDTAVSEAIVEKIMLRKNQVSGYYFQRIKGAWMLREVKTTAISDNANASFLAFYQKFVTDSLFQVESLSPTVEFVGPDPDDDFSMMEGVITADTWEAFAPQLPSKVLYNIVYGKPGGDADTKIYLMRGISNGLELELRFKKVAGRWLLTKMMT